MMRALVTQKWRLVPLVLVAALAVPVVWRLATVPPTFSIREWLHDPALAGERRVVELNPLGPIEESETFVLGLTTPDAAALTRFDEIALRVAAAGAESRLVSAILRLEGTPCVFRAKSDATLRVDDWLVLYPDSCVPFTGTPTGNLLLEVTQLFSGRIALWSVAYDGPGPQLRIRNSPARVLVAGGGWPSPPATLNRIALLAYTWNVTPSVLWARLRAVFVLVCVGVWLLWPRASVSTPEWRRVLRASIGSALLMTGLALAHALLFPPLQSPDEPDHLLSLAALNGDTALPEETARLARRTHFQRLRHYAEQHFRETDIRRPFPITWSSDIHVEAVVLRSPLTSWWWAVSDTASERPIEQRLWALRRANALMFGTIVGLFIGLLALMLPEANAAALVMVLLAIPTLPFFGAQFSDTAVLVAVSLLAAACVTALVIDTRRTQWLGAPLGLVIGGVVLSGRRMWPLLLVIAAVLVGRAVTGGRARREVIVFWSGLAIAMIAAFWAAQVAGTFVYAASLIARLPEALRPAGDAVASQSWLVLLAPLALGAVELMMARLSIPPRAARWIGLGVAALAIVWLIGGLVSSYVRPYATAPAVLDLAAGPVPYIRQVLDAMAVPFRTGHHDLMLSLLFWSGLGWSDTLPPEWLSSAVIAATTIMCAWALGQAGRESAGRVLRMTLLVGGLAAALALFALGAFSLQYPVYGRYLIGWYLCIVVLAWTALARSGRAYWPWLVAALATHAYYLQLVPLRYF